MTDKYIRSYNLSDPDDTLLAIDGDGVTPQQNLNKFSEQSSDAATVIDVQSLVDQSVPTVTLTPKQQIKALEGTTDPKQQTKLAALKESEKERITIVEATLKKHPEAKQYEHDLANATEEWDTFNNVKYGQCMAVDGTVAELGSYDNLQTAVDKVSAEHGIEFINPQAQDALDTAKTKRLLKENKGGALTSMYGKSRNKKTIKKAAESKVDNVASAGKLETMVAVLGILGKNVIRNRKPNSGFKLLAGYKKNPLSKFNQKELGELDNVMKGLDPTWNGQIKDGVNTYRRSSFSNLSNDAAKTLGVEKTGLYKSLIKIARKKKFDRKVNKRIKKLKGKVT